MIANTDPFQDHLIPCRLVTRGHYVVCDSAMHIFPLRCATARRMANVRFCRRYLWPLLTNISNLDDGTNSYGAGCLSGRVEQGFLQTWSLCFSSLEDHVSFGCFCYFLRELACN
eukprot:s1005_g15.t1